MFYWFILEWTCHENMVLNDMALHKILLLLYAVLQHVCVCSAYTQIILMRNKYWWKRFWLGGTCIFSSLLHCNTSKQYFWNYWNTVNCHITFLSSWHFLQLLGRPNSAVVGGLYCHCHCSGNFPQYVKLPTNVAVAGVGGKLIKDIPHGPDC